jgi:hypothetical protein
MIDSFKHEIIATALVLISVLFYFAAINIYLRLPSDRDDLCCFHPDHLCLHLCWQR